MNLKAFLTTLLRTFCIVAASSGIAIAADRAIDLDAAGVLDRLERSQPKRYQAIAQALKIAQHQSCATTEAKTTLVQFDIKDLNCAPILKTSNPPKRTVSFSVDGQAYFAVVTITESAPHLQSLEHAPK